MNFISKSGKLFTAILCTVILLQTVTYSQSTTETADGENISVHSCVYEATQTLDNSIIYGDINGDKVVNVGDFGLLEDYLMGGRSLSDQSIIAADIDENGIIDTIDLDYILKFILQIVYKLPVMSNENPVLSAVDINIGSVSGRYGDTVEVPVKILSKIPSNGISNYGLKIVYDPQIFEFSGISDQNEAIFNKDSAGVITLIGRNKIDEDFIEKNNGVIANISIKIKKDVALGEYEIKAESLGMGSYDNGYINRITDKYNSGKITINQIKLGDIDGDMSYETNDFVALRNYLRGTDFTYASCLAASDVDQNGVIDTIDCSYIKNYLLQDDGVIDKAFPIGQNPNPQNEIVHINIDSVSGRIGDTVAIPIRFGQVDEVPSSGFDNFGLILKYDTKLFEYVNGTGISTMFINPDKNGAVHITSYFKTTKDDLIANECKVATVNLKIKDNAPAGSYGLKVESLGMGSFNGKYINRITDKYITGEITVKPIELKDINEDGICNKMDYEILRDYLIGKISTLPLRSMIAADIDQNGIVDVGDLRYLLFLDDVPRISDITDTANINIGSVSGQNGETVLVPVVLEKAPSVGINSLGFSLNFDSNFLELINVSDKMGKLDYYDNKAGCTGVIIRCDSMKAGEITKIEFKIKDTAKPGKYKIEAKSLGMEGLINDSAIKINATYNSGEIVVASEITPTPSTQTPTPTKPIETSDQTIKPTSRTSSGGGGGGGRATKSTPTPKPTQTLTPTSTTIQTPTIPITPTPAREVIEPTVEIPGSILQDINGHWAKENIVRLYKKKIISGYGDGKIKPNDTINRNEASVILFKLLGANEDNSLDIYFKDKDSIPGWVKPSLSVLYNYNIMNGLDNGTFSGNKILTRAEAATALINTLNCLNGEIMSEDDIHENYIPQELNKYKDYNKKHWANKYLDKAIIKGLMTGYADGIIRPNQNITRAEFFLMCDKLLDILKK